VHPVGSYCMDLFLHLRHIPVSLFQCAQEMQTLHMTMKICVVSPVDQNHFHMLYSHYQVPVMVGNYFNSRHSVIMAHYDRSTV